MADRQVAKAAAPEMIARPRKRTVSPIVPGGNIARRSLTLLIAIMSFIACLTAGAVSLVEQSARNWQSQISREATIQLRPMEGADMEVSLQRARDLAAGFDGVANARIVPAQESAALLEPWLGQGLSLEELPVPRLVIVTIDENDPPDLAALGRAVSLQVANASLDDHRTWVARLAAMARTTTYAGAVVLLLVLTALALTVVFATRGALASNQPVIEVMHFVGARSGFIAAQFQTRFLVIGLSGAFAGGVLAMLVFAGAQLWSRNTTTALEAEQISALFGNFAIGAGVYAGMFILIILVGALTALTTRLTVLANLREIDEERSDPSRT